MAKRPLGARIARDFQMNKLKYLMILPVLIYLAFFAYKPMAGLIIAFQDYRPNLGIAGSKFVGFKNFLTFFRDPFFTRLVRNTFSISALTILFGFPAPILLALMINELRHKMVKGAAQTITYMPYFISMVVVSALVRQYVKQDGLISIIAQAFGGTPQNWLMSTKYFYPIYVLSDIWQTIGWNSIIYLAALTSIDQDQYESARIDGANRIQQMFRITLPNLIPTISILFILRMGGIMNVGFEKILLLYNEAIYPVADVISTYVYRRGIMQAAFSFAAAAGLFNSVINVIFLLVSNFISKRTTESSLF